jgi:hypothetical protein
MPLRQLGRRASVSAIAIILVAGALAAPALGRTSGRTLPVEPNDVYARLLFGGLAAVARDSAHGPAMAGVVQQSTSVGRELAVSVEVRDEAAAAAVVAAGLRVANRAGSGADLILEGYVSDSRIRGLASVPGLRSVSPIRRHWTDAFVGNEVALHGADTWHAAGFTGGGVKIGIIDGGFQGISALLGTEVPGTIHARCYTEVGAFSSSLTGCENGEQHGTAVAEAAVDMAPGVSLYIANPISFLDGQAVITWMTSQGVRIINASYSSGLLFEGPGDGTTSLSQSTYADINAATSKGALWVNSAGNHADGGWNGPWADTDANGFLEFSPGDENETFHLAKGQNVRIAIRWAEPWGHATANYNMAIYYHGESEPLEIGSSFGTAVPARVLDFTAPATDDYDISIGRLSGAATSRIQLLVASEYELAMSHVVKANTLPSPADSANPLMLTVGAADAATPTVVEAFSSQGPTLDDRIKPDITGADCVDTVAIEQFCGTSEASPFVAGGAALVLGANPTFTNAQVIEYLKSHATAIGPAPNNSAGWGLMNLGPVPPPPPGAAHAVLFQVQPGGAAATVPFTTQPVVRVVDAASGTVTSGAGSTAAVTLALGANPGAATLTCQGGLTRAAVAGLATFAGCTLSAPGSGYTIVATAAGLTPATSTPFDVGPAPPPVPLVFLATPAPGPANGPLNPAPSVKVADPSGNPITAGPAATAPITLALGANPSAGSLFCSGGLTVPAVAGVATFTGCRISAAGDGYTLVATSPGLVQATSDPISMTAVVAGPDIALTTTATAITWGTAVTLDVRVTGPAGNPAALTGRTVHLQASPDRATWRGVSDLVLDAGGAASLAYRPVTNLFYRAVFDGASDLGGAVSGTPRVTVRQLIALRPDNHGAIKSVKKGAKVIFTVTVRPARPDVPAGRVVLELYQKVSGTWRRTAVQTALPSAAGQAVFSVTFGTVAGQRYVRATANPTSVNANSFWTERQFYTVT